MRPVLGYGKCRHNLRQASYLAARRFESNARRVSVTHPLFSLRGVPHLQQRRPSGLTLRA